MSPLDGGASWTRVGVGACALAVATFAGVLVLTLGAPTGSVELFTLTASASVAGAVALLLMVATQSHRRADERLVRAQDKIEAILDRVGDGVVVTDRHGRVVQCNDAAASVLGRRPDRLIGHPCAEALGLLGGDRPLDCSEGCALLAATGDESPVIGIEAWRRAPDGGRQPLLVNAARVSSGSAETEEVVHSFRDITQLKQAEEAKTLFIATTSHELKTPLTVVQGFAEILRQGRYQGPEQYEQALDAIASRAEQLNHIVDRLLLTSRIDAGRISLDVETLDALPFITERVEAFATATGRKVDLEIPDGLPAIHADPEALATILEHLLDNAAKYSPPGEPIELRAEQDERTVSLHVSDRGIGMSTDQLERCFERFWQADQTEGRRFGGSGIGLYIVRSLAEAMDGEVRAASEPGAGTTFTLNVLRADIEQPAPISIESADHLGERSTVREVMRHIGIPERGRR